MAVSTRLRHPSPMARKFLESDDSMDSHLNLEAQSFRKEFFFYSTLINLSILSKVLGISYLPRIQAANIYGYRLKLWGCYSALVNGSEVVHGVAYEVQSAIEKEKLEAYERNQYYVAGCLIKLQDGATVFGSTFRWSGDPGELKERVWDMKDWNS